jgi:hypothetical protein
LAIPDQFGKVISNLSNLEQIGQVQTSFQTDRNNMRNYFKNGLRFVQKTYAPLITMFALQ